MTHDVTAQELGIDISASEGELFKWFLASFLFGKRIQQEIAVEAYQVIVDKYKRDTPSKLCGCTWQELVDMLGEGHYKRYDESTATRLLELCEKLNKAYGGRVSAIHEASNDRNDFEKRLRDFDGIGPKTVEIFMREAGPVLYD